MFSAPRVRLDPRRNRAPASAVLNPEQRDEVQTHIDRHHHDQSRVAFGPRRTATGAEHEATLRSEKQRFRDLAGAASLPWLDRELLETYVVDRSVSLHELQRLNAHLERQAMHSQEIQRAFMARAAVIQIIKSETCWGCHVAQRKAATASLEGSGGAHSHAIPTVPCSDASHRRLCALLFQHDERATELVAAVKQWRSGLNRPLPFLVGGHNVILVLALDIQRVVYPAQLHVLPCRAEPFYYASTFVTTITAAARELVNSAYMSSAAADPKKGGRRSTVGSKGAAQAFWLPSDHRGGQMAFAAADVARHARYSVVLTAQVPVTVVGELPEVRRGKTVHAVKSARIAAAAFLARPARPAVEFTEENDADDDKEDTKSIVVGDDPLARRRTSFFFVRADSAADLGVDLSGEEHGGDAGANSMKQRMVKISSTLRVLNALNQSVTQFSSGGSLAKVTSASSSNAAAWKGPKKTAHVGGTGGGKRASAAAFTGDFIRRASTMMFFTAPKGTPLTQRPRRDDGDDDDDDALIPTRAASPNAGHATPSATLGDDLPTPAYVAAEIDTQLNLVGEMLLRCAQAKYVTVLNLTGVVTFTPVPRPSTRGMDPDSIIRRAECRRPVMSRSDVTPTASPSGGARSVTPMLAQYSAPTPGLRSTPQPRRRSAAPPALLAPLPRRGPQQVAPSSPSGALPRPRQSAFGTPPLLSAVTTATSADNFRAELERTRRSATSMSTTQRQPPLKASVVTPTSSPLRVEAGGVTSWYGSRVEEDDSPHRYQNGSLQQQQLYLPVDSQGMAAFPDVQSLSWVMRCFGHAKNLLERTARRLALAQQCSAGAVVEAQLRAEAVDVDQLLDSSDDDDNADDGDTPHAAEQRLHRERRVAAAMAATSTVRTRAEYFQRWMQRTMRVRELHRLADVLLRHTQLAMRYVAVRKWRAVVDRRLVLRKRSQILDFSVHLQQCGEALRRWRQATLLQRLARTMNERFYLYYYNALARRVVLRRAAAKAVVTECIATALLCVDAIGLDATVDAVAQPTGGGAIITATSPVHDVISWHAPQSLQTVSACADCDDEARPNGLDVVADALCTADRARAACELLGPHGVAPPTPWHERGLTTPTYSLAFVAGAGTARRHPYLQFTIRAAVERSMNATAAIDEQLYYDRWLKQAADKSRHHTEAVRMQETVPVHLMPNV